MLNQATILIRYSAALFGIAIAATLVGCTSSYAVPGQPANLKTVELVADQTDPTISKTLAKQPLATFPCGVAAVRIQASGFNATGVETYGTGNYCVVTNRDIEAPTDTDKLAHMPMVLGISPLSRLLLPQQLNSDLELRQAAASVHADILIIYTVDSSTNVEDHLVPLSVCTLGLSPNTTADVVSTVSAVILDARNGYVYGNAEATEHGQQLTNSWMTSEASSDIRKTTETKAFGKLVDSLQGRWTDIVHTYAKAPSATTSESSPKSF